MPNFAFAALDRLVCVLMSFYAKLYCRFLCWAWGVRIGKGSSFSINTVIRTHRHGELTIGLGTQFKAYWRTNLVGLCNPTIIDTRPGGRIVIGDRCGFSSIVISSKSFIKIGNRVLCGGNVRIFDHDFHSLDPQHRGTRKDRENIRSRRIDIEDDVFIGTNAIILKGTHIGARSIVAAGSVLFGLDVPPDSMVKGNPAVIVGRNKKQKT